MKIINGLLILSLFVSCSTIPKIDQSHDKSIVVVFVERDKDSSAATFAKYELFYTEYRYLSADPYFPYSITSNLDPGSYRVNSIKIRYIESSQTAKDIDVNIPFETKKGSITILPIKIMIKVIKISDNKSTQYMNTGYMSHDDYIKCEEYLKKQKNIEGWEILYKK
ncbi:MAG TPA: hypothetical protein DIC34_10185 [Treponema sp.]|nr:hypothetical protein [Treponema sp.]